MKGPEQFKKTALGSVDLDIRGVVGTMQAEPRVFAHDAIPINVSDFGDLLMPAPTNSVGGEAGVSVFNRGCCLYVGVESNIEVQMESGRTCTFKRVPPGSFLPIMVIKIISAERIIEGGSTGNVSDGDLVSLW